MPQLKQPARQPIPDEVRAKLLLWCERHCCFCGKDCGVDIEIHHIEGRDNSEPENLIPVCYDCHARIPRYDTKNPRGTKIRKIEVVTRREQVYERHTRQYLEPVKFELGFPPQSLKNPGDFGHVASVVANMGDRFPIRLQTQLLFFVAGQPLQMWTEPDLYNGGKLWNFNPGTGMTGHFRIPIKRENWAEVRIECFMAIIDQVGRAHVQLPFTYVWGYIDQSPYYDPLVRFAAKEDVRPELRPRSLAWSWPT